MSIKLVGSINLARLTNVGVMTVKGKTGSKKCVMIPIDDNDIYVKVEDKVSQSGQPYTSKIYSLGCEVYERREADKYGNTHYAKCSVSKAWINSHSQEEVAERNKIYLGDFKPVEIPDGNQAATIAAPVVESIDDDDVLPF